MSLHNSFKRGPWQDCWPVDLQASRRGLFIPSILLKFFPHRKIHIDRPESTNTHGRHVLVGNKSEHHTHPECFQIFLKGFLRVKSMANFPHVDNQTNSQNSTPPRCELRIEGMTCDAWAEVSWSASFSIGRLLELRKHVLSYRFFDFVLVVRVIWESASFGTSFEPLKGVSNVWTYHVLIVVDRRTLVSHAKKICCLTKFKEYHLEMRTISLDTLLSNFHPLRPPM